MSKILRSSLFLILMSQFAFAQVIHVDYGEGLIIKMNEAYVMDINDDGSNDFFINEYHNELGFTPIEGAGCFTTDSQNDKTGWGAYQLSLHQEGDLLSMRFENLDFYFEDGRGSLHSEAYGSAKNWNHDEEQYIGFAAIIPEGVMNGWMKVKMDLNYNTLIVKEYAYQEIQNHFEGSIVVGDRGLVAVNDLDNVLQEINISPNPVSDFLRINFDYSGKDKLNISILNSAGQFIESEIYTQKQQYIFDTTDWTAGLYLINFSTPNGVHTEKVFVKN